MTLVLAELKRRFTMHLSASSTTKRKIILFMEKDNERNHLSASPDRIQICLYSKWSIEQAKNLAGQGNNPNLG